MSLPAVPDEAFDAIEQAFFHDFSFADVRPPYDHPHDTSIEWRLADGGQSGLKFVSRQVAGVHAVNRS